MDLQFHRKRTATVKIRNIYIFTVLFFAFYTSGFIYNFVFYNLNKFMKAANIAVICLGMPMLRQDKLKKLVIFVLAECFFIAWTMVAGGSFSTCIKIAVRFASLVLFFLICNEDSTKILLSIQQFIIFLAVIYLVAWFLFDIGPFVHLGEKIAVSIQHDDGSKRSWVYTSYFNIYYRWHDARVLFGYVFNSSNGPFWEPGMYQIWLNFALYYELFQKETNKLVVAVLILAVLSTTSTMGILAMAVIMFGYFYGRRKTLTKIALFIPLAFVMVAVLEYMINDKVSQVKGEFSLEARLSETLMLLEGIKKKPIFGHGLGTIGAINSFLLFIYDFGILALVSIFVWVRRIIKNQHNLVQSLVVMAWAVMSMVNESVLGMNLFLLVLLCLFQKKRYNDIIV